MAWLIRLLAGTKAFRRLILTALSRMITVEEIGPSPHTLSVQLRTMGSQIGLVSYGTAAPAESARSFFVDQIADRICAMVGTREGR